MFFHMLYSTALPMMEYSTMNGNRYTELCSMVSPSSKN